jgi:hypothetical protein
MAFGIFCRQRNEISGSIKNYEFLDQLSDYQFIKKDSAVCFSLIC